MPLLPHAIAEQVAADGLPRQATADDGGEHVLYKEGSTVRSMLATDWPPPLPADPTPAETAAALAAQDQATRDAARDAAQLRQQVLTRAQSAVGKRLDDLLVGERNALLALLLHKEGALNTDLTVRPLAQWVKG